MFLYKQVFFSGFSCVGLGARLVVESQGVLNYLGYTSNGHLFLSTFVLGGGG